MRAHEFLLSEQYTPDRNPSITLRMLNQQKLRWKKIQAEKEKRRAFLPTMYSKDDYHEKTLQQIERDKELIELEKEKVALAKERVELIRLQKAAGIKTDEALHRMSRSAMKERRKKKY